MIDLDTFSIVLGNLDLSIPVLAYSGIDVKLRGLHIDTCSLSLAALYEQSKSSFFERHLYKNFDDLHTLDKLSFYRVFSERLP